MQKSSIVWLVIRTCGLVFLGVFALKVMYFLINVVVLLTYVPETLPGETIRLINLDWGLLIDAVLSLALSVYCLRFGHRVHGWLMKEG